MDKDSPYYKQVLLLIRMLPVVATETVFALKGGTAINLFVRDFPRLSVDNLKNETINLPITRRSTCKLPLKKKRFGNSVSMMSGVNQA